MLLLERFAERDRITVSRVIEPEGGSATTAATEPLHARYPDGARDSEALFIDAAGTMYVVTKGRRGPIMLYRWPFGAPGQTVTLQQVRELFPEPENDQDRVTAATASPDRRWVGIGTYRTLHIFPASELLGESEVRPRSIDLAAFGEEQGEALVLADDGTVWTTTEADKGHQGPAVPPAVHVGRG